MTAEIAILNKAAVALAADSAVTISAGSAQQKIYDSEDKLFELTKKNAIGVMINNTMHFMEAPLGVLIKRYRESAPEFPFVKDAAKHFLEYLNDFALASPKRIIDDSVLVTARELLQNMTDFIKNEFNGEIFDSDNNLKKELIDGGNLGAIIPEIYNSISEKHLNFLERVLPTFDNALFVGDGSPCFSEDQRFQLVEMADNILGMATDEQKARAVVIIEMMMRKGGVVGNQTTGLVIAGFGSEELFPTLISFELSGTFGGQLRYRQLELVDIDRDGEKARVLPFAQREMVERFLYGLDKPIEEQIAKATQDFAGAISEKILESLEMAEPEMEALRQKINEAEGEFREGVNKTFEAIRADSRSEIEDMVEFMPKPEMGRMAEALINLTSIKRRVSRGFETVGGPIDVAVISRAEGFVWISRKHYFPRELNERYFARMRGA